ncbi:MAG: hypothetical protein HFJ95_02570 [Muribaculaceae bacterium]|nr:hypothetical protein [Muribaculaceae bacterium]
MNVLVESSSLKDKIISFAWQHLLLVVSLFIMTFGVALCVRSSLGSSVISTIPFVMTLAGGIGEAPRLTIGEYTYLMNFFLVGLQILILRKKFQPVQLFQLAIGFVFGALLDINMWITSAIACDTMLWQVLVQLMGCVVLAVGISMEIRCGSVTMPGEGITVAVNKATGIPFAKAKIMVDITLVVIAVALGYMYFGSWQWHVVGVGTLIAMVFVGAMVKALDPHFEWFTRVLYYRPGFRRYIYGLARYVYKRFN